MLNEMQLARFGVVGAIATAVHLTVAAILLYVLPIFPVVLINTFAFLLAFSVSFTGHRYYTFSREGSLFRFFFTSLIGLLTNTTIIIILDSLGANRFLAVFIGTSLSPIIVFVLAKHWAFKENEK